MAQLSKTSRCCWLFVRDKQRAREIQKGRTGVKCIFRSKFSARDGFIPGVSSCPSACNSRSLDARSGQVQRKLSCQTVKIWIPVHIPYWRAGQRIKLRLWSFHRAHFIEDYFIEDRFIEAHFIEESFHRDIISSRSLLYQTSASTVWRLCDRQTRAQNFFGLKSVTLKSRTHQRDEHWILTDRQEHGVYIKVTVTSQQRKENTNCFSMKWTSMKWLLDEKNLDEMTPRWNGPRWNGPRWNVLDEMKYNLKLRHRLEGGCSYVKLKYRLPPTPRRKRLVLAVSILRPPRRADVLKHKRTNDELTGRTGSYFWIVCRHGHVFSVGAGSDLRLGGRRAGLTLALLAL